MFLTHSRFSTVEAVANKTPEKREAACIGSFYVLLAFVIDQYDMIAFLIPGSVYVFANFEVSIRTNNKCTAVSPCAQTIRCKPVNAEITDGAIITKDSSIAEVFKFRVFTVGVICSVGSGDFCCFGAGKKENLFNLVAA